ncbi:MAG: dihydropteroate synthase [Planctomycetota bacterium]|jgi:dihydropteroate synthase
MNGPAAAPAPWLVGRGRRLCLDEPRLIGIVNVTPDSFSDGGELETVEAAIERSLAMVDAGAAIIDIGGESSRPGAASVDADEQIRRTEPVIRGVRARSDVLLSIDTTRAPVARSALDAGADIINDVSAGLDDESMFDLAADRGCGLILMHRRARPHAEQYSHEYDQPPAYEDVVETVCAFLRERVAAATSRGVDGASIVVDPGLGFGKTVQQNLELIGRTAELLDLGHPVLGAASRKSFLGAATGTELPRDRDAASVATTCLQYVGGVRLFRVHDVAAHRQAVLVTRAALAASKEGMSPPAR